MKVIYRPAAIEDIRCAVTYISNELKNPQAAQRLKEKLLFSVSLLKDNPQMGNFLSNKYEYIETDIMYIVVNKQLVFYRVCGDVIDVIRILDGRTDYLSHLF